MVRWKYTSAALLILALGIWAALSLFPTDAKKVKRQFRLLAEYASKEAGEPPLMTAQKIRNLETLFADPCEIQAPRLGLGGSFPRQEISLMAAAARARYSRLVLRLHDLTVSFPKKDEARVTLTARLIGQAAGGQEVDEPHELECRLKKIEDRWRFIRMEIVEVLKR